MRPHLNYGDVIYHNQRDDLMKLIEQAKAALIVSGCWHGTSRGEIEAAFFGGRGSGVEVGVNGDRVSM